MSIRLHKGAESFGVSGFRVSDFRVYCLGRCGGGRLLRAMYEVYDGFILLKDRLTSVIAIAPAEQFIREFFESW